MESRSDDNISKELQSINNTKKLKKKSTKYSSHNSDYEEIILNCSYITPKMANQPMRLRTIFPLTRYKLLTGTLDYINKHSSFNLISNTEDDFSNSDTENDSPSTDNEINDFNEKDAKEKSNEDHKSESKEKKAKEENNELEKEVNDNYTQNIFFGDENEFQIIKKIGEGASSIVYKVINKQSKQIMCKKILKIKEEPNFKNLQNFLKEFDALNNLKHPCICKIYGINLDEQFNNKFTDYEPDTEPITTVSLFIEFIPYKLSSCIKNKKLNNTQKVKIALEIAFGMSHIHKKGMMHRDLKIDNIMLNDSYEAKIIDFDQVKIDISDSLTKGVGTLKYMSPEMLNEKQYDNKCDVYSYGIVLFVIFTGHIPNQSLKEKITNGQITCFPNSMAKYCIKLIKKCTESDPSNRPSFDEIIEDMKNNSFKLAEGIDSNVINRRYQKLKNLKF